MRMTVGQFFVIIVARARSALVVFVCVLFVAAAVSLLMPKRYTASVSVLLDVRSPDPTSDGLIAGGLVAGMLAPGYMSTQVQVVTSERVARRAIHALGLQSSAELKEEWIDQTDGMGDFEAWLTEKLHKRLDVAASRDSNVIDISYSARSPEQAAATANAFMQAYMDTALELKVEPARDYNTFFDERARRLREDLEAAQNRLSDFQRVNQLLVSTERINVENSRLNDLSAQMVVLQSNAAQNEGKRAQASARPEQLPEVLGDAVVTQLTASLASEQARLQELTGRYGANHPQLIEQRARLAELKNKLDVATARATGSVNVNTSVNQNQLTHLQKLYGEQRARVLKLQTLRDEAAVLRRDVDNAQAAYNAMQQRVIQTRVESQNTRTNVSVLKRATEPASASSPKWLRNMGAAVFLGALLALATAFLRELRDRRVRTVADVEIELGQPLLLSLPVSTLLPTPSGDVRIRGIKGRTPVGSPNPNAT